MKINVSEQTLLLIEAALDKLVEAERSTADEAVKAMLAKHYAAILEDVA